MKKPLQQGMGFQEKKACVLQKDSKLLICCVLAPEEMDGFFNWLWLFNPTLAKPFSPNVFF